jgi:hypothetical protein
MITTAIKNYSALYSRSGKNYVSPHGYVNWKIRMILKGEGWDVFVFFVTDIESTRSNFRSQSLQRIFLFLPLERYDAIIDLLRNEKPVYVHFDEDHPDQAVIAIDSEPVGEGEICCLLADDDTPSEPSNDIPRGFNLFEEHADGYSWSNSYILALSSYHVYGSGEASGGGEFLQEFSDRFDPWMRHGTGVSARFDLISDDQVLGGTGLQAIMMSNDRYMILVFRGTQTIFSPLPLDWMTNAAFAGAPLPAPWADAGVHIHGGWLSAADKVYPEVLDLIQEHRGSESKPLWIAGHSLGGSLSLITALRLQTTGDYPVQGIHTYGAPPTGALFWYKSYNAHGLQNRTQRWVNNDDIVPQLPLAGFSAVGLKNFIDAAGNITLNAPTSSPTFPSVADHDIATYSQLIRNKLSDSLKDELPFVN